MAVTTCRVTDDWLPLTAVALAALGWREGDTIKLEVIDGVLVAERTETPENDRVFASPPRK